MPLYCYKCDKCGFETELVLGINERNNPLNQPCVNCNTENTTKREYKKAIYLDESVLNADKNMERSGVLSNLERIKRHHPTMNWG